MSENYKIQITVEGEDKASVPLDNVGGALGRVGSIAGGILGAAVLQKLATGLLDLGKSALTAYADYERLGMTLQSLTARELMNTGQAENMGQALEMSADQAKKLQGWVQELAIKSPFTQKDIADSFRMSMAYGFQTDMAQRLTKAMVNYSAATGASGDVMSRVSLALGQINSRGKLAGQEIMQLTEAGIPVRQILAKSFGVTTGELEKMISKGLIPADKAIEAITTSIETDFAGAAERQATTFSGLISSLQDIKEVGLREFFTGTFQAIQPYVTKFVDVLSSPETMAKINELGQSVGSMVNDVMKFIAPAAGYFSKVFGSIFEAGLFDGTGFSTEFLEAFSSFLPEDMQAQFMEFANGINEAFGKFGQFWTENGAGITEIVRNLFGTIATEFGPVVNGILEFLVGYLNKMGDWYLANAPLIQQFLANVGAVIGFIFTAVANLWPMVQATFEFLLERVLNIGKMLMQIFTGDFASALETAKTILSDSVAYIWETLQLLAVWVLETFFGKTFEEGKIIVDDSIKAIIKWFENLKDKAIGIINGIRDGFNNIASAIQRAIDKVKAFLKEVADAVIPDWWGAVFGNQRRAEGGSVYPGQSYIVGERGPELFTPSMTGRIIPNDELASSSGGGGSTSNRTFNITVNNLDSGMDENRLASAIKQWELIYAV